MNALRIRAERMREQRQLNEWAARNTAMPAYFANGTTWTCKRCGDLAWATPHGALGGCNCSPDLGPSPLVPNDIDAFFKPLEMDPEQSRAWDIEETARNLLDTMNLIGADGKALFKISDEHDNASADLLRHAVLNLHAALDGTTPPALTLPQETH